MTSSIPTELLPIKPENILIYHNVILPRPFVFNDQQENCVCEITKFISFGKVCVSTIPRMLINGSAGTGKTSVIIQTIINYIINDIIINIEHINKPKFTLRLKKFIVAAPTNKAKDVLMEKFLSSIKRIYDINTPEFTNNNIKLFRIVNLVMRCISFNTLSQILCVNKVVTDSGNEEFVRGSITKIIKKFNKTQYNNTTIIIDESSMIDEGSYEMIRKLPIPVIFIADYCQLPPVNEQLSRVFNINNQDITKFILLDKVERCTNSVTTMANRIRAKIYGEIDEITEGKFNLLYELKQIPDITIYHKKFSMWYADYVNSIKSRLKEFDLILNSNNNPNQAKSKYVLSENDDIGNDTELASESGESSIDKLDNMALGWTNKCCAYLNKNIRNAIYADVENVDLENNYLVKGDKILIKSPYYKYKIRLSSSQIAYIKTVRDEIYNPLSFFEWIDCNNYVYTMRHLHKSNAVVNMPIDININTNIDINTILQTKSAATKSATTSTTNKSPNKLTDYFNKVNDADNSNSAAKNSPDATNTPVKKVYDIAKFRRDFYKFHIVDNDAIPAFLTWLFQTTAGINNISDISMTANMTANEMAPANYQDAINYTTELNEYLVQEAKCEYGITNIAKWLEYDLLTQISRSGIPATDQLNLYNRWHNLASAKLFGCPNDKIYCKKCIIFSQKCIKMMDKSVCGNEIIVSTLKMFNNITNKLAKLKIYIADIITITEHRKVDFRNIPIINMMNQEIMDIFGHLREAIKSGNDIKIELSKEEADDLFKDDDYEYDINNIGSAVDNDEDIDNMQQQSKPRARKMAASAVSNTSNSNSNSNSNTDAEKVIISISQILGHYYSHIYSNVFSDVDYGYALTVHKSQGSTYGDVYIELDDMCKNFKMSERERLIYTAITRTSNKLFIYM